MIQIEQIRTGVIQENCYLVYNEEALLIIDPGAEGASLEEAIDQIDVKKYFGNIEKEDLLGLIY